MLLLLKVQLMSTNLDNLLFSFPNLNQLLHPSSTELSVADNHFEWLFNSRPIS